MAVLSFKPGFRSVLMFLAATFSAGCTTPGYVGRRHVTAELAGRTGYVLGPEKAACDVVVPEIVDWQDGLSEDEAVNLGLWNNPGFQELLADLGITAAAVIEADQLANPQVSTLFPLSAKQWEFTLTLPIDVLWLRPRRLAAAQLESNRVAERLVQDGLDVVRDIRLAYVDLVLAQQRLRLAEEGLQLRSQIAQTAEARLRAGAVAELDVSTMRLEVMFSREEVTRATYDVDLARERLRMLLGIGATEIRIETTALAEVPAADLRVDDLVWEAIGSRPDLRAVNLGVAAACERARLARCDYLGISAILPDINAKGDRGFEAGPGLGLKIPIFNQNQGVIAREEAEAQRLRRQYARLQDDAALEVRQAYTRLVQAQQTAWIWREQVVPEATAAVAAASRALEEDGVSLVLVLETTRQLLDARWRELAALADVHRAVAELERGVGRRVFIEPAAGGSGVPGGGERLIFPEPAPLAPEVIP
jgi:cobalt-zinc-cadmium efflux system outer membrane protein